jgi:hypothetical protein
MADSGYFFNDPTPEEEQQRRVLAYAQAMGASRDAAGPNAGIANAGRRLASAFIQREAGKRLENLGTDRAANYARAIGNVTGPSDNSQWDAGGGMDASGDPGQLQVSPRVGSSPAQRLAATMNPDLMRQVGPTLAAQSIDPLQQIQLEKERAALALSKGQLQATQGLYDNPSQSGPSPQPQQAPPMATPSPQGPMPDGGVTPPTPGQGTPIGAPGQVAGPGAPSPQPDASAPQPPQGGIPDGVRQQMATAARFGGPAAAAKIYSEWATEQNKIFDQRGGNQLKTGAGVPVGAQNPMQLPPGSPYEIDPATGGLKPRLGGPADPKVIAANAGVRTTAEQKAKAASPAPSDDPNVQSWMHTVLSGNATMAQVPQAYRTSVSNALENAPPDSYSPLVASRYAMASTRIASNFLKLPAFQLTANGLPYLQRIDAAIKTPGSVSDQDLLDSLTKLNTSGNAVTEEQVRLITGYKSFKDMAETFGNKFQNGGALSTQQRQDIQTIAKNIYANYAKGYQPVYDQVTKQLKQAGIPKPFWTVPDLNDLAASSGMTPPSALAAPPVTRIPGAGAAGSAPPSGRRGRPRRDRSRPASALFRP